MKDNYTRKVSCEATVSTIEEAFAFVVTRIDSEDIKYPEISILPKWNYREQQGDNYYVIYEVSVSGEIGIL